MSAFLPLSNLLASAARVRERSPGSFPPVYRASVGARDSPSVGCGLERPRYLRKGAIRLSILSSLIGTLCRRRLDDSLRVERALGRALQPLAVIGSAG